MKLREIRNKRNFRIQDVADYLCCGTSVYSRYETGAREPSIDVLLKLSRLYDVSVDYLIGNDVITNTSITKQEAEWIEAMRKADERARCDALALLNLHASEQDN